MADRDQKTFAALPQKRERAREQGQVARSRDLTAAI
jgi:flagellar biosynthesis protein FlhB